MNNDKIKTICLECHGEISLESDVKAGEVVTCPECSSDLEVESIQPIKLTIAPVAQEDWGE